MQTNPGLMLWGQKRYRSLNYDLQEYFKEKVVKISLDAGFTCPNRDGTLSVGGCAFCSARGSGDFAGMPQMSIAQQFNQGRRLLSRKWQAQKFIAYFQAFTNTYAPVEKLRWLYESALAQPGVVGLAIATRPDCLSEEALDLLEELNQRTFLWVELGLQTIHQRTVKLLNMHYDCDTFSMALDRLKRRNIAVCTHLILGLPGENREDMMKSAEFVARHTVQGLKIHALHLIQNTALARMYAKEPFSLMNESEYVNLVVDILEILSPEVTIHRLTGDGPRSLLIGPEWTLRKHHVLNSIDTCLKKRNTWQGRLYKA